MPSPAREKRSRGQSFVEFALILPVLLLMILLAVDFGRLFYAWITLNNAARIGANYAGIYPLGRLASGFGPGSEYDTLVRNEGLNALSVICPLSGGATAAPPPTFIDTTGNGNTIDLGDQASVVISCDFQIITPVIDRIIGQNLQLSASSVFMIRAGAFP